MADELHNIEQKRAEHFVNNETLHSSAQTALTELAVTMEKGQTFEPKKLGLAMLAICERISESCENYHSEAQGQDEKTIFAYEAIKEWLENDMQSTGKEQYVRPFAAFMEEIKNYKEIQPYLANGELSYSKFYLPTQNYLDKYDEKGIFILVGMGKNQSGEYRAVIEINDEATLIRSEKANELERVMKVGRQQIKIHNAEVKFTSDKKVASATADGNLRMPDEVLQATQELVSN